MSIFKSLKQKCLGTSSEKPPSARSDSHYYATPIYNDVLDENQVTLLTKWLDQLNRENFITVTPQNDIVVMTNGPNDQAQHIFINADDVDDYMERKTGSSRVSDQTKTIAMSDIARVLLKCGYVTGTSGQLSFRAQTIAVDSKELTWLMSIVHDARSDPQCGETQVKLCDGENTQLLHIPQEYMPLTNDVRAVANYLFRNGHVRYDVETGTYAYRYVEPDILLDEEYTSSERIKQRQFLSFHVNRIYVDEQNKRVELEFTHEPTRRLVLPAYWYRQLLAHHFERNYVIDLLLANGGVIDRDTFTFMSNVYSLRATGMTRAASTSKLSSSLKAVNLSPKQKYDLIHRYIDLISEKGGTKYDDTHQLLVLENVTDGGRMYFTEKDTEFIRQNQFQRQDVVDVLINYGQIKEEESGDWLLHYNHQYIRFPPSLFVTSTGSQQNLTNSFRPIDKRYSHSTHSRSRSLSTTTDNDDEEYFKEYHSIIDYMCRNGLVIWDKRSRLIKLNFADQTLLLPIDHLRSIVDQRVLSSASTINGVLPFSSRQLTRWLLNNSYIIPKNNKHNTS